jgi:hypothetical protein
VAGRLTDRVAHAGRRGCCNAARPRHMSIAEPAGIAVGSSQGMTTTSAP